MCLANLQFFEIPFLYNDVAFYAQNNHTKEYIRQLFNILIYLTKEYIKEDRSTTKLRIVFDARAKYNGTSSLNEILCKGSCLKFRIYPIAIIADIEKAYLQISINKEHREFLRFLWYSDLSEEIISKYRFTRVIFGVTS